MCDTLLKIRCQQHHLKLILIQHQRGVLLLLLQPLLCYHDKIKSALLHPCYTPGELKAAVISSHVILVVNTWCLDTTAYSPCVVNKVLVLFPALSFLHSVGEREWCEGDLCSWLSKLASISSIISVGLHHRNTVTYYLLTLHEFGQWTSVSV